MAMALPKTLQRVSVGRLRDRRQAAEIQRLVIALDDGRDRTRRHGGGQFRPLPFHRRVVRLPERLTANRAGQRYLGKAWPPQVYAHLVVTVLVGVHILWAAISSLLFQ